ncbi:MAG: acetyl-CoA carboxylase biotin carboxyl carrier protein subunit [Fimbriimonadaceae bacterium]|nr:acetyl-CoA carboxylase biotin carboxyl carrier protein subunit [Fimbriimonadaceae bacterium]QYK56205.1 MAG: acetyl-CoA carboxylase biotin carboxyl carrier protein subunit [Fimbriimonadaceae bacterium]
MNGHESDLGHAPENVEVVRLSDRLSVRTPEGSATALAVRRGDRTLVSFRGRTYVVTPAFQHAAAETPLAGESLTPMPGQIVEVFVKEGDEVEAGQRLVVLEAMKMQHTISAPFDGRVASVLVAKGDQIGEGKEVVQIDPAPEP